MFSARGLVKRWSPRSWKKSELAIQIRIYLSLCGHACSPQLLTQYHIAFCSPSVLDTVPDKNIYYRPALQRCLDPNVLQWDGIFTEIQGDRKGGNCNALESPIALRSTETLFEDLWPILWQVFVAVPCICDNLPVLTIKVQYRFAGTIFRQCSWALAVSYKRRWLLCFDPCVQFVL